EGGDLGGQVLFVRGGPLGGEDQLVVLAQPFGVAADPRQLLTEPVGDAGPAPDAAGLVAPAAADGLLVVLRGVGAAAGSPRLEELRSADLGFERGRVALENLLDLLEGLLELAGLAVDGREPQLDADQPLGRV